MAEPRNETKAKEDIKLAAASAIDVITKAASDAGRVISDAAAVALNVLSAKGAGDHDLLIELKTRMEGLKGDIKAISDGTGARIAEHEVRLCALEAAKGRQTVFVTVGIVLVAILMSMVIYHLFQIKI